MPSELTLEERAKKISIGYPSHQGVLNHLRAVQAETEERVRREEREQIARKIESWRYSDLASLIDAIRLGMVE